jgi:hypothetical protein
MYTLLANEPTISRRQVQSYIDDDDDDDDDDNNDSNNKTCFNLPA